MGMEAEFGESEVEMCCWVTALDLSVLGYVGCVLWFFGIDIHGMEFFFQSPLLLSGANRYYGQREDWRRCFEEFLYWFPFVVCIG